MADAQILAAERDHRRSAETERFGTENRRLDDVEAGLEAAVGLHADLVAQIVHAQRLVRFRHAAFPRRTVVLHRRNRRRSEARRVGKERVSTCSSRWSPSHKKKTTKTHNVNNVIRIYLL